MNRKMLDMLACPMDKHFPLELFEIRAEGDVIGEGALFCTKCARFYPIMDEIPIMLPDELREKDREMGFLRDNEDLLPKKIIRHAAPWHL